MIDTHTPLPLEPSLFLRNKDSFTLTEIFNQIFLHAKISKTTKALSGGEGYLVKFLEYFKWLFKFIIWFCLLLHFTFFKALIHSFCKHWAGNLMPEQPQPLGIQRQAPHRLCPQEPQSLRGQWSPKWENAQPCTVKLECKKMGPNCYFCWFLPSSYQDLGN